MKSKEISHILIAIILLTLVSSISFIIKSQWEKLPLILVFSLIVILVAVLSKKIVAYLLDSDIEHELWQISRLSFKKSKSFKKPFPTGIILPLILSIISLGSIKLTTFLTYETRALKYRASKRFGFYSYTAMTDFHNGIIGAATTISLLILATITYFLPNANLEYLAKLSVYYAFWNLIPISKLDGTQIFFGSRILWAILMTITAIALILTLVVV